MKRVAIVYMAHDGFTSLYTGVGAIAQDFLLSFPQVAKNLKQEFKKYTFDCYATTIKYNKNCFGFSEIVKTNTENFIKQNKNTHLIELLNGSNADESYATIDYWKAASISGATFIYLLSLQYDEVIAITVDTPFTQVANYFFKQYDTANVKILWLPQSTVLIHREKEKSLSKAEKERYVWEKDVIDLATKNKDVFIGYIGDFMRKHLIEDYSAKLSRLINFSNGLYLEGLKKNITTQDNIKSLLHSLEIPLERPLLLSFGRTELYKGLDLVLDNVSGIAKEYNFFTVVLTAPYDDEAGKSMFKKLKKFETNDKKNIKVISTQNFSLPHKIMQWKKTFILAILSRAEPFGLIPIESRFYNNKNLTLIVSNRGGLKDQVASGNDGFVTSLDKKSIRESFKKVAKLSLKDKEKIAINGYKKVIASYDQVDTNTKFIFEMLKKIICI